jgi:ferric-dicitrate binding protein FerR (iron transport regulator)
MERDIPWNKLGKYILGECTPEELEEIEAWLERDPERYDLLNQLEDIYDHAELNEHWDLDEGWEEISKELANRNGEDTESYLRLVKSTTNQIENRGSNSNSNKKNRFFGFRAVASLIFLLVTFLAIYMFNQDQEQAANRSLVMEEVVTQKGQRSQFRLSDGTRVWLNAQSRLEILNQFNSETREVRLEGEAFFAVEPNPEKPFIVKTSGSITKVLGTQFNVHAYPEEDIQVVVEEGKVAFGSINENINDAPKITTNQMGILSVSGKKEIIDVRPEQYLGWMEDRLIFKDTPFDIVVKKLERWYDINCTISDSTLLERSVTATFHDEPMTEVLKIISLSLGATYTKENRSVTFLSKDDMIKSKLDN